MKENIRDKLSDLLDDLNHLKSQGISSREVSSHDFEEFISKMKSEITGLEEHISHRDLNHQLQSLINFKTIGELEPFRRVLIRFFAPSQYGKLGLDWTRRGKFIFDLDQIELKLRGAIYKIDNNEI